MCFCLCVAIVFCVLCVVCCVCVCRMRERQRDITRAAGEGGCLASDGWGLYFHINHIGVAEQLLRALCQSLMWAFGFVCDAVVSCKIMIGPSSYHTAFIFAHACMTQQHC